MSFPAQAAAPHQSTTAGANKSGGAGSASSVHAAHEHDCRGFYSDVSSTDPVAPVMFGPFQHHWATFWARFNRETQTSFGKAAQSVCGNAASQPSAAGYAQPAPCKTGHSGKAPKQVSPPPGPTENLFHHHSENLAFC